MTTSDFIAAIEGLIDDPRAAGIRVLTHYESAIGPTVTPPAGTLRADGQDVNGEFSMPDGTQAVTVDSWGAQAARMGAAVESLADSIGFPLVRILDSEGRLLTTSVRLSHRHADATWRACRPQIEEAGIPYAAIQEATVGAADELVRWFPTALLFGWWHSHVKRATAKDTQERTQQLVRGVGDRVIVEAIPAYARMTPDARAARLITAEIVAKGIHRRHRMAARVDTLFGPLKEAAKAGDKSTGRSDKSTGPSALGLGSLPPVSIGRAPVDVTYSSIEGYWYLSLAGLRFVDVTHLDRRQSRVLLICLALLLRRAVELESRLRAGTELVAMPGAQMRVLRHGADPDLFDEPSREELTEVVRQLGAQVGWSGPVDVNMPENSVLDRIAQLADPSES